MLLLCGPTYPTRLWCAWELCTLFSFMRQEQALTRVVLLPLNKDPDCDVSYSLLKFDVNEARCYDPNEEMGLRKVIAGVGLERFNNRIHALAVAFQESQANGNRNASGQGRRLSSFSFNIGSTRDSGFKSRSGLGIAFSRVTQKFRRLPSANAGPRKVRSTDLDDRELTVVTSGNIDDALAANGSGRGEGEGESSDRKSAWGGDGGRGGRGAADRAIEPAGGGSPALTSRVSIGIIHRQVTEAPPASPLCNTPEEKAPDEGYTTTDLDP
mmetsp:Transcript_60679/g.166623  ORF Transcript_60679/g.166623 Transcript_60679/m.166623 type:complete len:269 (+) Transcript_60679:3-809(+)